MSIFVTLQPQKTIKMKNYKTLFFITMLGFPLSFSAQTAPSFKELVDAAMTKDAAIEQQNLESKANGLDQQKLNPNHAVEIF